MQFLFLQGIKRSGNHLFVDWLSAQAGGLAHCNNYFYQVDEELDDAGHGMIEVPFEDSLAQAMTFLHAERRVMAVVSFEHPGRLAPAQVQRIFTRAAEHLEPRAMHHQHILRDPFNWMASYARMQAANRLRGVADGEPASFDETRGNYAVHQADYWQRWLRAATLWSAQPESGRIDYNRFVAHRAYRQALASRFGLDFAAGDDARVLGALASQGSSFSADTTLCGDVAQRYAFALPLFREFPPPAAVWQAAGQLYPALAEDVASALSA